MDEVGACFGGKGVVGDGEIGCAGVVKDGSDGRTIDGDGIACSEACSVDHNTGASCIGDIGGDVIDEGRDTRLNAKDEGRALLSVGVFKHHCIESRLKERGVDAELELCFGDEGGGKDLKVGGEDEGTSGKVTSAQRDGDLGVGVGDIGRHGGDNGRWGGGDRKGEGLRLVDLAADIDAVLDGVLAGGESCGAEVGKGAVGIGDGACDTGGCGGRIGEVRLAIDQKFGDGGRRAPVLSIDAQGGEDAVGIDLCDRGRPDEGIDLGIGIGLEVEERGIAAFACGKLKEDLVGVGGHTVGVECAVGVLRTACTADEGAGDIEIGSKIDALGIFDHDLGVGGAACAGHFAELGAVNVPSEAAPAKLCCGADSIHHRRRYGFGKEGEFIAAVVAFFDLEVIGACGELLKIQRIDREL